MNKEVLITAGLVVAGVTLVLVLRDNLPKQSFRFVKG